MSFTHSLTRLRNKCSKALFLLLASVAVWGSPLPAFSQEEPAPLDYSKITEESLKTDLPRYFEDKALTKVKSKIKVDQIENPFIRQLVTAAKSGQYDVKSRAHTYTAYEPVNILAKRMKTSEYSKYENPTGICFEDDEKVVLYADGIKEEGISLKVRDFRDNKEFSHPIENGINVFPVKNRGLAYISYYTPNFKTAPKIKVHILSGKVNGVFDSSVHKKEDWAKILNGTTCEMLDIVGKQVHLVYSTEKLKEFCPERGLELINLYDELIHMQHQIMGLIKYKKQPKNRMLGRSMWRGFMHADGMGAAFHNDTLKELADPDRLRKGAWGVSHEFGHVNQVRPGMKWVSTTEVTNNLYSIWAQYKMNPAYVNLEDEHHNDGDGNRVKGGRFNAYLNYAIVHGEQWLCQRGPDKMNDYQNGGDHFVKLCPLWQLQLYFMVARQGNPEFLADIFEIVRNTDETKLSNGQLQLNFMKNVCDTTKQDLTDFFVTAGMLKPIDKDMDDYSRAQLTITKADCDKLIRYAKKYKKPASPVIHYISRRSVDAYIKRLPVSGTYGEGVAVKGNTITVSHDVWKNVTVFEAYKDKELVRITLVGTNFPEDNSATLVQYPEGCTSLEAVSWDGKRTLVYGKRPGGKK